MLSGHPEYVTNLIALKRTQLRNPSKGTWAVSINRDKRYAFLPNTCGGLGTSRVFLVGQVMTLTSKADWTCQLLRSQSPWLHPPAQPPNL